MPGPYSQDLREKAVAAVVTSGGAISAVSQAFGIHRNTLSEWVTRYREIGDVSSKQNYQQGHSHKITDWEAFRAFAKDHGDKTQAEMAQLWPDEISEDTIGRGLKRIGFTRKKRPMRIENEIARNAKHS